MSGVPTLVTPLATYRNDTPYPFCLGCGHGPILDQLNKALVELRLDPRHVVIVSDIGCAGLSDQYFATNAFHGLHGRSITYATGIKLARPEVPVMSVVGDGSALYTIQALWTAAHHKIPVTWVIANNRSYRILKLNMLDYLGEGAAGREFVAMDMTEPALDFAQIAASFGVKGVRIEHPDEIGDALREAQASEEPRLLDIVIDGDVKSRWL